MRRPYGLRYGKDFYNNKALYIYVCVCVCVRSLTLLSEPPF